MNRIFLYMICAVYCSAIVGMDDKKLIGGVPVGALQKKYAAVLLKNRYKKQSSTLASKWFAAACNTALRLIDKAKYDTESVYLWTMPRQSDGSYDLLDCSLGCLEICLRHGASVNAGKESGILKEWTPLYYALGGRELPRVKLLLEHKADVNMQVDGRSHLFRTCNAESLKLMLEAGGNPNVRNALEWTPLYYDLVGKDLPRVKLLLEHKADINMQVDGVSHLFRAWNAQSLKLMLKAGGNPNVVSIRRQSALEYFEEKPLQRELILFGAQPTDKQTQDVYNSMSEDYMNDPILTKHGNRFKKTLASHLPVSQGRGGNPMVDIAISYLAADPKHFNLYLQIILNQQKVQRNLAQGCKRIEDLNKTLPPERQRKMPPHLLSVADATAAPSASAKEKDHKDYDEVKKDADGNIVLPRSTSPADTLLD